MRPLWIRRLKSVEQLMVRRNFRHSIRFFRPMVRKMFMIVVVAGYATSHPGSADSLPVVQARSGHSAADYRQHGTLPSHCVLT